MAAPIGRGLPPGFEPPPEWDIPTRPEDLGYAEERRRWCPLCWLIRALKAVLP